jgi:AraC-like DNA-binding protein
MNRLRDLDPSGWQWIVAGTWAEADELIRAHPADLAVLDPLVQGEAGVVEVERLRAQFPSLPMLLYTTLSPTTAAVLLRLGRAGVRRVVFARFEDAPANLRRAVAKELEHAVVQEILRSFDTLFWKLPETLRYAIESSLRVPGNRMNAETLAGHAGMTRHECQTWFARARLPAPRVTLMLLRLLYAHRLLLDPGHTVDDVARKLGYGKPQTLQTQLRMAFGMTAGEIRQTLPANDAIEAVQARYFGARLADIDSADLLLVPG